jgi:formate hydrogenlyase transcriptional activator
VADLLLTYGDLADLFRDLAERLQKLAPLEVASFALHDPAKNAMWVHGWEHSKPATTPVRVPTEASLSGWVWKSQKPLIVRERTIHDPGFRKDMDWLKKKGLRSYCTLPLTTPLRRLGAVGMGSSEVRAYKKTDLRWLRRVADLVALAVENALTRAALNREKSRLQTLLSAGREWISHRKLGDLLREISLRLRNLVGHDYASLSLYDKTTNAFRTHLLALPFAPGLAGSPPTIPDFVVPFDQTPATGFSRETSIFGYQELIKGPGTHAVQFVQQGYRSLCCMPLLSGKNSFGTLNLASMRDGAFVPQDIAFLNQLAAQIAAALDNANAYHEMAERCDKLAKEKLCLQGEIRSQLNFEEIIGESAFLKRALGQVTTVAPSDALVLILGEAGTGKELIARVIHRLSCRKNGSFIKLNCTAIPASLLESELFGYETGAFTGAETENVGLLELADNGTLFLDEFGDIPPTLQDKLLRVLEDHEFEGLRGKRTIRANVRLIAATRRPLTQAVAHHRFRSDLYSRLDICPIHVPALRERPEDIPLLVRYFVQKFCQKMNKHIETISSETMTALVRWAWPGNVRELQNFVERSVMHTAGNVLNPPLAELSNSLEPETEGTLENMEREFIVRVLRATGGVVSGAHGAATRLGLKRTTLQSKMLKMGISRRNFQV